MSQSSGTTSFAAGSGIGQAVTVGENISINDFGFYLNQVPSGTVDFFIYDASSSSVTLAPRSVDAPVRGWDYLNGLDVNLNAGDLYYFGVYGNAGTLWVGSNTTADFLSDGLGIPGGISALGVPLGVSTLDFTGYTPTTTAGPNDISLRIFSTDPPATTPEPSSLMLLGSGILAGAAVVRRKFVR